MYIESAAREAAMREPDHRLVVRDRAVPGDGRQRIRVGDGPALEQEVSGLIVDEHRRAVVAAGLGVDADEA